jgi:transposase
MNPTLIHEIVSLSQGGASMRRIARSLGISRATVRRVLEHLLQARGEGRLDCPPRPRQRRASQLDPYESTIAELLARYPDITIQRVYEELRGLGFSGSYTIVRNRMAALRPRGAALPVQRFETAPGEQAQMDYAVYDIDFLDEGRRRVSAFSYVLGYSRRQYLHFVESQDFTTTIREHIQAFEHLGGAAATCLYDNMKVVVSGYDGEEPIYNPRFLGFAAHYGFRPVACRPHRPQTKGKVERPFAYVETSLLNGRTFRSLDHLNEVTAWWLAEVADLRIHRQTKMRPIDRHAEERARLVPLPVRPYDSAEVVSRTVDAEGYVVYRQNFYSAPWRLVGETMTVRITAHELIIHDRSLAEVTRHPLFPAKSVGLRSFHKEHEPPRNPERRAEQLAARFAEFEAVGSQFLEGLLRAARCGKSQAEQVLALVADYPRRDVLAALERAVRYGAFSLAAIKRILATTSQPLAPWETQSEEHVAYLQSLLQGGQAGPRPTSEYQDLLQEPADAAHAEGPSSADPEEVQLGGEDGGTPAQPV